jgi:hypothetical protein
MIRAGRRAPAVFGTNPHICLDRPLRMPRPSVTGHDQHAALRQFGPRRCGDLHTVRPRHPEIRHRHAGRVRAREREVEASSLTAGRLLDPSAGAPGRPIGRRVADRCPRSQVRAGPSSRIRRHGCRERAAKLVFRPGVSPGTTKAPVDDRGLHIWSGRRGSNSRPQPWQGCALPTELRPHCPRPAFTDRCEHQPT